MKVVVICAADEHWNITTPVAVVDSTEKAAEVINDFEEDSDVSYTYRTVEYLQ